MFVQGTLRSLDRNFFQSLHSTLQIELKVIPERVLSDIHQLRDLPMRETMTLEPQRFHPSLHQRNRVAIALIVQFFKHLR